MSINMSMKFDCLKPFRYFLRAKGIRVFFQALSLLTLAVSPWQKLYAQTVEEIQALDLGTVAVLDNSTVGTIEIDLDSFTRTSGGVRLLQVGQPAIMRAQGFDPERRLYITVQANQGGTVTDQVSQEQFVVQRYDAEEFVITDESGNVDFVVGGVFATSGSGGTNFRDTVFRAQYTVTVNY
ncbi:MULTISPECIES: hypothetical protein [Alteromonadaceae]|uniref:DUF4402 domain-containing protein n=1 Tax=Brumicola blandensis TaxID=3075611 RepID=A0AAW8R0R0_9ALTE|nr:MULTISPECIES: hypothetical protein [unclassified Alteromonas]MDT0582881.1 hypothetical protein [Alteromonas sp. W409]MDT0628297.1 hypothetical protein [Alteromonas sp. W364]